MTSVLKLISTSEACEILKVTPSAISRMVARGDLRPAKRLPGERGAFLFKRDAVEKMQIARLGAHAESAAS